MLQWVHHGVPWCGLRHGFMVYQKQKKIDRIAFGTMVERLVLRQPEVVTEEIVISCAQIAALHGKLDAMVRLL